MASVAVVLALLLQACMPESAGRGAAGGDSGPCTSVDTGAAIDTGALPDNDSDGFPASIDCDDEDPAVHPEADEICNGIDDDCDGGVDDDDKQGAIDAESWFADADGDGFGSDSSSIVACVGPKGWVLAGGDCNDATAEAAPGLPEVCGDGLDNDCDGTANGCRATGVWPIGKVETTRWELNSESLDVPEYVYALDTSVDAGAGARLWVASGSYPCKLSVYGIEPRTESGAAKTAASVHLSAKDYPCSEDGAVGPAAAVEAGWDLDGDGWDDLLAGVPQFVPTSGEGAPNPDAYGSGAVFVAWGPLEGEVAAWPDEHRIVGAPSQELGGSVAAVSDVTGDGLPEVVVGARAGGGGSSGSTAGYGAVLIFQGPVDEYTDANEAAATWYGVDWLGDLGHEVIVAGDINGDGLSEILAGDPEGETTGSRAKAYLIDAELAGVFAASDAAGTVVGVPDSWSDFGWSLAGEFDWNGDGYGDVAIGDPGSSAAADSEGGSVYVFAGPLGERTEAADSIVEFAGTVSQERLGRTLHVADFDGDGSPDVAIGTACGEDCTEVEPDGSKVLVVYGPTTGVLLGTDADLAITLGGTGMLQYPRQIDSISSGDGVQLVVSSLYSGDSLDRGAGVLSLVPMLGM